MLNPNFVFDEFAPKLNALDYKSIKDYIQHKRDAERLRKEARDQVIDVLKETVPIDAETFITQELSKITTYSHLSNPLWAELIHTEIKQVPKITTFIYKSGNFFIGDSKPRLDSYYRSITALLNKALIGKGFKLRYITNSDYYEINPLETETKKLVLEVDYLGDLPDMRITEIARNLSEFVTAQYLSGAMENSADISPIIVFNESPAVENDLTQTHENTTADNKSEYFKNMGFVPVWQTSESRNRKTPENKKYVSCGIFDGEKFSQYIPTQYENFIRYSYRFCSNANTNTTKMISLMNNFVPDTSEYKNKKDELQNSRNNETRVISTEESRIEHDNMTLDYLISRAEDSVRTLNDVLINSDYSFIEACRNYRKFCDKVTSLKRSIYNSGEHIANEIYNDIVSMGYKINADTIKNPDVRTIAHYFVNNLPYYDIEDLQDAICNVSPAFTGYWVNDKIHFDRSMTIEEIVTACDIYEDIISHDGLMFNTIYVDRQILKTGWAQELQSCNHKPNPEHSEMANGIIHAMSHLQEDIFIT